MSPQEKVNILLVDDQPAKLLSYELILEELGETLIKVGSASEALEQLLKRDIAVVLIDVCMPDLDGFELAAMIRQHPRFERLSIIFVSAIQVNELDLLRGYALGAVDYVPVPVVPDLLRAKVKVFAELYRKTRQLEALNAELEERVADRTAALARANADLELRVEERTREREQALAQVHEMQKVESLGQLTGGVAHDFNNLLTVVLGNLSLLKKRVPDDEKGQRLIDGAIQSAERGATLTKRMLAFARRQHLQPETVDVAALVEGITEMMGRSLGPSIQIGTDFEPDLPLVTIDPNQLELALLNLALNARDAMPSGGDLIISGRARGLASDRPSALYPGNYVCVSVIDTGTGMDPATRRRATEPFFTTKEIGRGTGLGLSMVEGLVAQSGGALRLQSTLGQGTSVELWLPATGVAEARPAAVPGKAELPAAKRCRVLVVDDDPLVLAGVMAMLEDLGHAVIGANSAASALDVLAQDSEVDLVISDHAMPTMSGLELLREIRRRFPSLPLVLSSGFAEFSGSDDAGVPRLMKPFRQEELATLIVKLAPPEFRAPGFAATA